MANPQIENGYTRIANELLEALCLAKLSANEYKVVLCIIRHTYGYGKTSTELSIKQISLIVGIDPCNVSKIITKLAKNNIITVSNNSYNKPRTLAVQKDFEKWEKGLLNQQLLNQQLLNQQLLNQQPQSCQINNPGVVSLTTVPIKKKIKKNIKKTIENFSEENPHENFEPEWFGKLWEMYPEDGRRGKSKIGKNGFLELEKSGFDRVKKALENYVEHLRKNKWKHPQDAGRWFGESWKEWAPVETSNDLFIDPRVFGLIEQREKKEGQESD